MIALPMVVLLVIDVSVSVGRIQFTVSAILLSLVLSGVDLLSYPAIVSAWVCP